MPVVNCVHQGAAEHIAHGLNLGLLEVCSCMDRHVM